MSKKIYLFSLVLLALAFTACSETEETSRYDNWQARSVAFIDSIASVYDSPENQTLANDDPEKLHRYKDEVTGQWIYVKKVKNGTGKELPQYTSTVSAHYRMSYFNGDVVQQTYTGTEPTEFDSPANFTLNGVISGWSYTLIHMVAGDFWTLYIPYQSGYGSSTNDGNLQAYSALVYNVRLEKIVER
ncbi:peptidylprolyl isomerase [Bacteroides sp. HF-5092]|uniref:Peptidyl-prolyl cis-trans isomerase n=2 Tax=Bacteroides TaxID=816 RepID=A0A1G6G823_BACOV|nr:MULTISPECIES: FKBP-type peptidyl-prolyl cis-trans isomerase [Bacteroides]TRX47718.1 peptidylprolyl isomerase [Bacteroides sp. HF-5092]SDB78148.1 FKBP-type peptidyl-prolyl cis-trans isomerase FklB [Bacteroides ovatus]SFM99741.1 FKBP-type peptidyl-prolyl cis-trans isomerase FklB [Bacteroides xylanisolvens]